MTIKEILKVSRPRFWLYEAGTFALIGAVAAHQGLTFFSDWRYWIFTFYFLIPANILIYGINDIFDYETDKTNPKKVTYEALVPPNQQKTLWKWIVFSNAPFFFLVPLQVSLAVPFFAFVFFATFYSAEPIRAKAKPFIDSLFSAGHYVATGVFGFYLAGGMGVPYTAVIAAMCWAVAMHAYSAVPDIESDIEAGLYTIAILIGQKKTLYFCWFLYLLSAYLVFGQLPLVAVIGAVVFSLLMILSLRTKSPESLFQIYTYFPYINVAVGTLLSISLLVQNLR